MIRPRGREPSRRAQLRYLEAGLEVLAERGRSGLKLADLCRHVGTTSGSFYHAFTSWTAFTDELVRYWREEKSALRIAASERVASPRGRLEHFVSTGSAPARRSEAAIRAWGSVDPRVGAVVAEVDRERLDALVSSYEDLVADADDARRHAVAAMHLLIGHETSAMGDADDLHWAFHLLLQHAVDSAPPGGSREVAPRP